MDLELTLLNWLRLFPADPPPQATKHHPSSVDLELIKRLVGSSTAASLTAFLSKEFDCVSRDLAGEGEHVSLLTCRVAACCLLPSCPRSLTACRATWRCACLQCARLCLAT